MQAMLGERLPQIMHGGVERHRPDGRRFLIYYDHGEVLDKLRR